MANSLESADIILADDVIEKSLSTMFNFKKALDWKEIIARDMVYKALSMDSVHGFYTTSERNFLLSII